MLGGHQKQQNIDITQFVFAASATGTAAGTAAAGTAAAGTAAAGTAGGAGGAGGVAFDGWLADKLGCTGFRHGHDKSCRSVRG